MRRFLAVAATVLLLAGCGGASGNMPQETESAPSPSPSSSASSSASSSGTARGDLETVSIEASGGKEVEVRAEIADDYFEQARGLMGRENLGEDRGMLFVYGSEQEHSFWMKGTRIPLSIAYIGSSGRIVDIQDMEPVPPEEQTVPDSELPRYPSAEPAQYALEVNRGFFERRGVEVGDRVRLPE